MAFNDRINGELRKDFPISEGSCENCAPIGKGPDVGGVDPLRTSGRNQAQGNPSMKVFVINLEQSKDRMASMRRQLDALHVEFERFPAVWGKTLSPSELHRSFCPVRSYLSEGSRLTLGAIGCALSHDAVYARMIKDGIAAAVVLEDDVLIDERLPDVLGRIDARIDVARPQVYMLSSHGVADAGINDFARVGGAMCTDGYVITRPAAELIYRTNFPVISVCDKWRRWVKRHGLELYQSWPSVVRQDNATFGTLINETMPKRARGLWWLVRKMIRAVEKLIDWTLYVITGR